ncbi:beta-ribofuranosylaminobenzene 5'-phosphate synthase family protein [Methyloglobulus sp.]|uniref:beta-ribofuranosylaminobenzene 5'-phosphate synthase family protein n=1 Tax=Methyloglobulus sp. TaxID=2518622 RepID=UPI003988B690
MSSFTRISVSAPARLHMGFIDLSGSLGRHFGSIGIALNEINTWLTLSKAGQRRITGPSAQRADRCLTQLCDALNVSDQLNITIESAIPEHVGLGSGTQMALAIGSALNAYYGLGLTVRDIASVMDRGLRSGIGIGVFEHGGLVVDGGRGEKTITPPVLVHLHVPSDWRFILVFDRRGQGLHGKQEIAAFESLPPFTQHEAEHLCYLIMMQGLPAVAEHDLKQFGHVISQLQQAVGKHFSPAQGGIYASKEVAKAMAWLTQQSAVAVGQTSWGPTGFCAVESADLAEEIVQQARAQFEDLVNLDFAVVSANNQKGTSRLVLSDG